MRIFVHDKMQTGYKYDLVCPEGENFDISFQPELTPADMLALGVFEGKYLNDCQKEFPASWFKNAQLSSRFPDIQCNCFKVKSRLSLPEWQSKGWIYEPDPRGWFQWYCRYYLGRRIPEIDQIQIKRWHSFRRHHAQVEKNCGLFDLKCRPKQRQAILQWAYNPFI